MNSIDKIYAQLPEKINSKHNSFPSVDVRDFLLKQGIEFEDSGQWLKMKCILPNDHKDSNPSFFVHSEHGGWNCYVCGHGNWGQLCEQMGWKIKENKIGGALLLDDISVHESIWKDVVRDVTDKKSDHEVIFVPPSNIKLITKYDKEYYKYLIQRRIVKAIKDFKLSYCEGFDAQYELKYNNRILIPVHDCKGKYLWCDSRAIYDNMNRWYRPEVDKMKYLFNYHRVVKKFGYDYVILVESAIDVITLWLWNVPAVSCFGGYVSDEQLSMLINFMKVYVCLDNDKAGIKGYKKLKLKISNFSFGTEFIRMKLPRGVDVNMLNFSKIKKIKHDGINIRLNDALYI